MEWGIDTWIFSELPIDKALSKIKDSKINYVEIAYEHFEKEEKSGNLEKMFEELKSIANSLDLKIVQIHGPFGDFDHQFGSINESLRSSAVKRVFNWIRLMNKFDFTAILVLHTGLVQPDPDISSEYLLYRARDINTKNFFEIGKVAQDFGVRVAIENRLESTFGALPNDLIELVRSLNNDYLGICLDTGHANVNKVSPAKAARIFGDYLIATHIHDNNGKGDQHLPPLMGNINWKDFISSLTDLNYKNPIIVEIPGGLGDVELGMNKIKLVSLIMNELLK